MALSCPLLASLLASPSFPTSCSLVHVLTHVFSSHTTSRAARGPLASPAPPSSSARCGVGRRWPRAVAVALGEGQSEAAIVPRGPLRLPGCIPAKTVVSSRLERSRLAAVSAALGSAPRGQRAPPDRSTRLVDPPLLFPCLAVLQQARPAPSPRSPLATVRRRGLAARSCSLRAALLPSSSSTASSTPLLQVLCVLHSS